jgi:uncharacterized protein
MATITALTIYPIKSCRGTSLPRAELTAAGLAHDREWMVVDAQGQFLTQRQHPRMALIRPHLREGVLEIHPPAENTHGMGVLEVPLGSFALRQADRKVHVWNHSCMAFDEGDAAAEWFTNVLGLPARLVRFDPSHKRLSNKDWTGSIDAYNRFSDGYPILAISEASLADLNDRMQENGFGTLPMNRFRPNIVVSGTGPYDEDRVMGFESEDGNVRLATAKPCARCPIPGINQETAERQDDPLPVLASYREDLRVGGVTFGQNLVVARGVGAWLEVGQSLTEDWNF